MGSVLSFGVSSWGGNISKQDRDRLDKIIRKAGTVVGEKQEDLTSLCKKYTLNKLTDILNDKTHPLHDEFHNRQIERSGSLRVPKSRTCRYANSFVHRSIVLYNE